jgi:peptidoglycan hydrolase-like protein with peptidoglycan-binding domain
LTTVAQTTSPTTPTTATTASTSTTPSTPSPRRAPTVTLKPGAEGASVKLLQQALTRLGYEPGPVDGSYGASTRLALMRFQRKVGLTADGILGPLTLQELRRAVAAGA